MYNFIKHIFWWYFNQETSDGRSNISIKSHSFYYLLNVVWLFLTSVRYQPGSLSLVWSFPGQWMLGKPSALKHSVLPWGSVVTLCIFRTKKTPILSFKSINTKQALWAMPEFWISGLNTCSGNETQGFWALLGWRTFKPTSDTARKGLAVQQRDERVHSGHGAQVYLNIAL